LDLTACFAGAFIVLDKQPDDNHNSQLK